ncbi:MAG: DNA adenine methylase, partial [Candidatus Omnitrophota bacterium]
MVSYTVIPRLGNKTTALKHLRPLFQSMLGSYYCEPFLGSGCVLREIKRINPDAYCLVGDCDDLLSNFYIQAFMNTDALVELVNNAPMHENIFNQLKSGEYTDPLY